MSTCAQLARLPLCGAHFTSSHDCAQLAGSRGQRSAVSSHRAVVWYCQRWLGPAVTGTPVTRTGTHVTTKSLFPSGHTVLAMLACCWSSCLGVTLGGKSAQEVCASGCFLGSLQVSAVTPSNRSLYIFKGLLTMPISTLLPRKSPVSSRMSSLCVQSCKSIFCYFAIHNEHIIQPDLHLKISILMA